MRTIRVTFEDGSGWIFTLKSGNRLWEMDGFHTDGSVDGQVGIIANDSRKRLIDGALKNATSVTITASGGR